jgi:protein TonB
MSNNYFDNSEVKSLLDKHMKRSNRELYDKLHDKESYYNNGKGASQKKVVDYLFNLKKRTKVDRERRNAMLRNLGLAMSLGLILLAFEWKSWDRPELVELNGNLGTNDEILDVPVTEQPPPPPPKNVIKHANIVEVPDVEEIKDEIELDLDLEVSEESSIEEVVFPVMEEPKEEVAEEIFVIVEEQPLPEGGFETFYKYIGQNIKYPVQAKRMGVSGKVFVTFVIEKNGKISQAEVVKGIGAGCDEEAIRVLNSAPIRWTPGKQRGQPVRTKMVIPIHFTLK